MKRRHVMIPKFFFRQNYSPLPLSHTNFNSHLFILYEWFLILIFLKLIIMIILNWLNIIKKIMMCVNKYFFINNLKELLKNNLKCRKLNRRKTIINFQKGIIWDGWRKKRMKIFLWKKVKGFCRLKTVKHMGLLVALLALKVTAPDSKLRQFWRIAKSQRNFLFLSNSNF